MIDAFPLLLLVGVVVACGGTIVFALVGGVAGLTLGVLRDKAVRPTTRVSERTTRLLEKFPARRSIGELIEALSACPSDWRPLRESNGALEFAAWDDADFEAFRAERLSHGARIERVALSYSKMRFELAAMACARSDWSTALACADVGLQLESDHPLLLCARGLALEGVGRPREALGCYSTAAAGLRWNAAHRALAEEFATALSAELAPRR